MQERGEVVGKGRGHPRHEPYDTWGRRVGMLIMCDAWKRQKEISAEEGIVAIPYEKLYGPWRYASRGRKWGFTLRMLTLSSILFFFNHFFEFLIYLEKNDDFEIEHQTYFILV